MKGKLLSDLLTQLMNPRSFGVIFGIPGLSNQSYNVDPIELEKDRKEYSQICANKIIEKCGKEEGTKLVQRIIAFAIANGASRNIIPDVF